MAYNIDHLKTAGKVTIFTMLLGIAVFAAIFLLNLPNKDIETAVAQDTATTSVTVLNTPPTWTVAAQEDPESSVAWPTNVGDDVIWTAVGTDANSDPYYLLICMNNATPTANNGAAPECDAPTTTWAVSGQTTSAATATAATTTESGWAENNDWYAWICDDNNDTPSSARCNLTYEQGSGTTSSPFIVNHRPTFTAFVDDSPAYPGDVVTFTTTASDPDVFSVADTVQLTVCSTNSWSTTTGCAATTLATSTFDASDPTGTYTVVIPTQDTTFGAWGFVMDNHGFAASGGSHATDAVLEVLNATPTVASSTISLAQTNATGSNIYLTEEAGETTGFELSFTVTDANSCDAVGGGAADEITDYVISVYRSGIGSTTCDGSAGAYDANNCYVSGVPTTTWNLSCNASSTSCTGSMDQDIVYDCTFPLWYIADPTDGTATSTQYSTQDWRAAVSAVDDNNATSTHTEGQDGVELISFLAFTLDTLTIPYGSLAPGDQTDPLSATTTLLATGNVGLDQRLIGTSMCTTYSPSTLCPPSATSTIPEDQQVFATTTANYVDGTALSSTTLQELEINIPKSTSTVTQASRATYWGIAVPGTITLSGDYEGENTFYAIVGESSDW